MSSYAHKRVNQFLKEAWEPQLQQIIYSSHEENVKAFISYFYHVQVQYNFLQQVIF